MAESVKTVKINAYRNVLSLFKDTPHYACFIQNHV